MGAVCRGAGGTRPAGGSRCEEGLGAEAGPCSGTAGHGRCRSGGRAGQPRCLWWLPPPARAAPRLRLGHARPAPRPREQVQAPSPLGSRSGGIDLAGGALRALGSCELIWLAGASVLAGREPQGHRGCSARCKGQLCGELGPGSPGRSPSARQSAEPSLLEAEPGSCLCSGSGSHGPPPLPGLGPHVSPCLSPRPGCLPAQQPSWPASCWRRWAAASQDTALPIPGLLRFGCVGCAAPWTKRNPAACTSAGLLLRR